MTLLLNYWEQKIIFSNKISKENNKNLIIENKNGGIFGQIFRLILCVDGKFVCQNVIDQFFLPLSFLTQTYTFNACQSCAESLLFNIVQLEFHPKKCSNLIRSFHYQMCASRIILPWLEQQIISVKIKFNEYFDKLIKIRADYFVSILVVVIHNALPCEFFAPKFACFLCKNLNMSIKKAGNCGSLWPWNFKMTSKNQIKLWQKTHDSICLPIYNSVDHWIQCQWHKHFIRKKIRKIFTNYL